MKRLSIVLFLVLSLIFYNCTSHAAYPTTTEHHKVYPYTSALASPYSCDPTGTLDIAASLEQIKANQSNVGTIHFPVGTYKLSTAFTLPAGMTFRFEAGSTLATSADVTINGKLNMLSGGLITIATTKTLTLNNPPEAGAYQIFDCIGTGKVVFGTGSVTTVYPEWWGAKTDGSDSLVAFQAAIDTGLKVIIGGIYTLDNSSAPLLFSETAGLSGWIEGQGWINSRLEFSSLAHPGIKINYTTAALTMVTIRGLNVVGPGGTMAGSFGIYVPGGVGTVISRLNIEDVRVGSFGDDGIRIQGPTGPVQIRDAYIYDCQGYGIKIAVDNANAIPQDVTISGGAIQGTCKGGISVDGTGSSIGSLIVIDCDIELDSSHTLPCLYLKNSYGNSFTNLTVASQAASLSVGDAVVYLDAGSSGNVFSGLLNAAHMGLHNIHIAGASRSNVFIGGFYYNKSNPPAGLGYFAKIHSSSVANSFIDPYLALGTYAADHDVVYEGNLYGSGCSICVGVDKSVQSIRMQIPSIVLQKSYDWLPNDGANISAGTAIIGDFELLGLLITDKVRVSMGTCSGGTAKWFIQAVPEDTSLVRVSLFNGTGVDRAFGTTTIPIHVTVYRQP